MLQRQGVYGNGRPPEEERLQDEDSLRLGHEAVEGNDEEQDERGVIAEQVATHDGHERRVEMAEEPQPLVEDCQVERRIAVPVVHLEAEQAEPEDVRGEQHRHGQVPPLRRGSYPNSWRCERGLGPAARDFTRHR